MRRPPMPLPLFTLLLLIPLGSGQQESPGCDITDATACPLAQVCAPRIGGGGVCVQPPVSGAVLATREDGFPIPLAYFPLTGHSLETWPNADRNGLIQGAVWRQDHEFGSVLHCAESLQDSVVLDNVPIGSEGPFTVNLWMKKSPTSTFAGELFQFLFSVTSASVDQPTQQTTLSPTQPNQMHLFLPEEGALGHGVLRAIVRDGDDDGAPFHLDSDGRVNATTPRASGTRGVDLADGEWHMITLTSLPSRRRTKKGYRLFLDGELAAEAEDAALPGGDPMTLDGRLHLCERVDGDVMRHFDGSVAKLSIFDEALRPRQVEAMFVAVRRSTISRQVTSTADLRVWNEESNLTLFVDEDVGLRYVRGPETDVALLGRTDNSSATTPPNTFSLSQFLSSAELCPTSPVTTGLDVRDFCSEDEVCVTAHSSVAGLLQEATEGSELGTSVLSGICAELPEGGSLWRGEDSGIPPPLAYFPMTGGDLSAWPIPNAQGTVVAASLVEDSVFGSVYECDQSRGSFLIFDNVAYGSSGSFAVNFWFKPTNLSGDAFQYLFSHGSFVPSRDVWVENQVQIFMSEDGSAAPGIVRAIVKDTSDTEPAPAGRMYLDSDGDVALTTLKDPERTAAEQTADIRDGQWHMLTITSRDDLKKGFSMYLDGELVGEVRDDLFYTGDDGILRPATGGDALRPGGKMYFCGRYDGNNERHFSGRVAEVMMFDAPLRDSQVMDLYTAAVQNASGLRGRRLLQTEIGTAVSAALVPDTELDNRIEGLPPGSWWGNFLTEPGTEFGSCTGNFLTAETDRAEAQLCGERLTCLPVLTADEDQELVRSGICVEFPDGGAYVFDAENEIEVPIAYFPLTDGKLESFPFPTFSGRHSGNSVFVHDDVFGSVVDCARSVNDSVILPSVPYPSQMGEFTVALWMRRREHHTGSESGFETIFSHIGNPDNFRGLVDPNQIQILLEKSNTSSAHFLRVVVRDDDDSDSDPRFVDVNEEVNVTDGKWHMIAITSHPRASHGFRVFVDGVMVGEARGARATGGDEIRLSSDVLLCGNADGTMTQHFDGHLAHLVLWNVALTEQELFALFERLILASEDVQIEHPLRTTIDGEACVFPAVLNGESVVDCSALDGVLKCPVRNGTWVECMEFEDDKDEIEAIPAIVLTTIDGETCLMPGLLGTREVFGCIDLNGVFSCEFRRGQWKECASLVELRYTVSGAPCVFPFTYLGKQYSDCVGSELADEEICQIANGDFERCVDPVFEDTARPPTAPRRAVATVDTVLSRITVDDELCSFPWWFEGRSVGGCVEINGTPTCQTLNGTFGECAPIVYTRDRTPCSFPFPSDSAMHFSCIRRMDESMCRVADGSWGVCEPEGRSIPVNEPLPLFPGRVTLTNESCAFPFWSEGASVSDCVGQEVERCRTADGALNECQQKRTTEDGDPCSFPFDLEGSLVFSCVEVNGSEQCRTVDGSFGVCAPVSSGTEERPSARVSVQNERCVFPFEYNGESRTECVELDGEESCKVRGDRWATCAPRVRMNVYSRTTTSGDDCTIPFALEGRLFSDCLVRDGREVCRIEGSQGALAECSERPNDLRPESTFVEYPFERNTTDGHPCSFPFHYSGDWWVDCVEIDGTESCKISDGSWQECSTASTITSVESPPVQRFTLDGDECGFPFVYNGEDVFDCVEIDDTESCKDVEGEWKECEPLENRASSVVPRFAIDGDTCIFPLFYNGEEHYTCVEIDGTESCKDDRGRWEECLPLNGDRTITVLGETNNEPSSSSSSLSTGAVIGIVAAVLIGVVVVVAVGGFALFKRQKHIDKNFEQSSKNFEKFEEDKEPGIAMGPMGRDKERQTRNGVEPEATHEIPL